jgi:hypothetical protein
MILRPLRQSSKSLQNCGPFNFQSCATISPVSTVNTSVDVSSRRSFSFYSTNQPGNTNYNNNNNRSTSRFSAPVYQIFGEESAFGLRAILPDFRLLDSGTIVLNKGGRGKVLLQWTPRGADGKYQWDNSTRFALTPEEAASVFLARLDPQKLVFWEYSQRGDAATESNVPVAMATVVRRPSMDTSLGSGNVADNNLPQKVFRASLQSDGSVELTVDYERDGMGGQDPPTTSERVR